MKVELTERAIKTVLNYTDGPEVMQGVSSSAVEGFMKASFDILQESIDAYLPENSPYRGMAHLKEYSQPILTGEIYCGEC